MLCPRYNTIFDKLIVKAFKASQIQKSFQKVQEIDNKGKKKKNINIILSQFKGHIIFFKGSHILLMQMFCRTNGFGREMKDLLF